MSLILEALKKSEAQRRLGEAPNLGTPITATRRQRSPLPWITLAVVIATGAGAWLVLRPHAATTGETPAVNAPALPGARKPQGPAQHANAAAAVKPAAQSAAASAPISVFPPTPARVTTPPATAAAAAPKPDATAPRQPAAAAAPTVVASREPAPAPTTPDPRAAAKSAADAEPSASSPGAQKAGAADNTAAAAGTAAPTATQVAQVAAPATAIRKAEPAAPAEPAIPTIFDLPFSLRHDLPELPVTMQVYSRDPARRFLLVGNARKKEGDQIGDVLVREIRPNGVVLEFHGQRFLLPRPGS